MSIKNNTTSLQELLEVAKNLPDAGSGEQITPVISVNQTNGLITATAGDKTATKQLAFQEAKTVTPSTESQIAVSSGYYTGGNITVAAIPSTYVKPSYTKAATTYTPTTTNQTISAGTYLTGVQTIKGDANLVAGNIKSGISIFGVDGTLVEGGDGSTVDDVSKAMITRTITEISDNEIKIIGAYAFFSCSKLTTANFQAATMIYGNAFAYCSSLTTVSFPAATYIVNWAFSRCSNLATISFPVVTTIGQQVFDGCTALTTASFPMATTIGIGAFEDCTNLTTISFPRANGVGKGAFANCVNLTAVSFPAALSIESYAFRGCSNLAAVSFPVATVIGIDAFRSCVNLTTVSIPACTTISDYAFFGCSKLTTVSFPAATTISDYAFGRCYNLKSLYLTGSSLCTLSNSNAFSSTPIGGYSTSAGTYGSIYVPASLLTSYKTATNWTYFSSRFYAVEDSVDTGGDTGGDTDTIFTLRISGVEYQAEDGMTWAEWCDSDYNIDGYYIDDEGYVYNGSHWVWTVSSGVVGSTEAEYANARINKDDQFELRDYAYEDLE